jgi:hypothetical protein
MAILHHITLYLCRQGTRLDSEVFVLHLCGMGLEYKSRNILFAVAFVKNVACSTLNVMTGVLTMTMQLIL